MTAIDVTADAARRALGARDEPDDVLIDRFARAVWSHLIEPGDGVAGRLIAHLGAGEALRRALADADVDGALTAQEYRDGRRRWLPRADAADVAHALMVARRHDISLLTPRDASWPSLLDDLGPHAPVCLWVRGDVTRIAPARAVAIVGARAASGYGEHVALEMSADLAGSGVTVVSGAAYGIDAAAHRAALACDGPTVAVLAGGADRAYPAGNTRLIDTIAASGAVVSESPPGASPTKWRFLQRNRIIAAVSHATVVVEAGWRSGSLNTASHALAIGRRVGAVPGPVTSAASAGCHRLLRTEPVDCITCADDVREMIGIGGAVPLALPTDGRPPTDDLTRIRDALSARGWRDRDDIARRSGHAPDDAASLLGILLLGGEVENSDAGWRLVPRASARSA